jgi:acyl-CoA thioesterase-1
VALIIFGDSICAGSNISDGNPCDVWVEKIRDLVCVPIINISRGGRPTASIDEFNKLVPSDCKDHSIIISLGANDARCLDQDMVQKAVHNIIVMSEIAKSRCIRQTLIFGPTNINKNALKATFEIRHERENNIRLLNEAYSKFADERNIKFHSLYGIIPDDTMGADGVHPNRYGNLIMAEKLTHVLGQYMGCT